MRKAYLKIVHEYSLIIEKCFSILWIELPNEM
jgi:hypothetical protein